MKKAIFALFSCLLTLVALPLCACRHPDVLEEEPTEPIVIIEHCCDLQGLCIQCGEQFDLSQFVLESICVDSNNAVKNCGIFVDAEGSQRFYKEIISSDLNMPIINLDGNVFEATKQQTIDIDFTYQSDEESYDGITGTIKLQGSTSLSFPKKNFTLKLDKKVQFKPEWGKQKKYCLKANYTDCSQSRNVVSATLYGQVVHSRNISDEVDALVNGGAIDGFPVVVFENGNFLGLYTLNIPKDKWLFGMEESEEKQQAILMADGHTEATTLKKPIDDVTEDWFEIEFYSNEKSKIDNSSAWVIDGFNEMVNFVIDNDGQAFKDGISNYVNVDRTIDSLIYTYAISAYDNLDKNILWLTFDGGKTWQSSCYDLDLTFGLDYLYNFANGDEDIDPNTLVFYSNLLWQKLYENFYDEICERYAELRQSVLSLENVKNTYNQFFEKISDVAFAADQEKWPYEIDWEKDTIDQIFTFIDNYFEKMDNFFVQKLN